MPDINNRTNQSIVAGSLGAVSKKNNSSIAMGFMGVKVLVMVDVSGSMMDRDTGDGSSRYEVAVKQLELLQAENPGEVAVCCFSNGAQFCPGGVPLMLSGTTDMVAALRMMLMADNTGIRLILISDGEPDDDEKTIALARKFKSKIDTVFVGSESGRGRSFLKELSAATGGISITTEVNQLGKLSDNITRLIAA